MRRGGGGGSQVFRTKRGFKQIAQVGEGAKWATGIKGKKGIKKSRLLPIEMRVEGWEGTRYLGGAGVGDGGEPGI